MDVTAVTSARCTSRPARGARAESILLGGGMPPSSSHVLEACIPHCLVAVDAGSMRAGQESLVDQEGSHSACPLEWGSHSAGRLDKGHNPAEAHTQCEDLGREVDLLRCCEPGQRELILLRRRGGQQKQLRPLGSGEVGSPDDNHVQLSSQVGFE
eukprot:4266130-Amphidinium_carterae.1